MSELIPEGEKIVQRETEAKTTPTLVSLNELEMLPQLYCHRGNDGLSEANVADLFNSLIMEGLQVPVEYYIDQERRKILTKGHRRVTACRILAQRNTARFSLDMKIPAIEVSEAPLKDLVVRSVMDNCTRQTLDNVGRIRAAMVLHKSGVEDKRAAVALDVSETSYKRDLLVGQHSWMFGHVLANRIGPTHAAQLLKVAVEKDCVDLLRDDLAIWFRAKEQEIDKKIKDRKEKGLKELSDAEKQVKSYLTGTLVKHWVEQIQVGVPFDDKADWAFRAGFDPETHELTIGSFRTNVDKEDPKHLIRMIAQLSQVNKLVLPIAKKRVEEGKSALTSTSSPYDLDLLRQEGLTEIADELEKQARQPAKEGEDEPGSEEPNNEGQQQSE